MAVHIKHEAGISVSTNARNLEMVVANYLNLYKDVMNNPNRKMPKKIFYPKIATSYALGGLNKMKKGAFFGGVSFLFYSLLYILKAPIEFYQQKFKK
jgi:hypothetical protein